MAAWSDTTKHLPSSINSGNQYTVDDDVSLQELNNTVENAFYAARVAENAQAATNNGVSYDAQTPTSTEQTQARTNIGAASASDLTTAQGNITSLQGDRAKVDASNLSSANITSWNSTLGVSILVAEKTLTSDSNSIVFNNLDLAADGGVYDFIIDPVLASTGFGYPNIKVNSLVSGYYKSTIYTSEYNLGTATVQGYGATNNSDFGIGNLTNKGICIGQLTLINGTIVSCNTNVTAVDSSYNSMYINSGFVFASNVTSLTFGISDKNYLTGTKIKIYKRATNTATRSQS